MGGGSKMSFMKKHISVVRAISFLLAITLLAGVCGCSAKKTTATGKGKSAEVWYAPSTQKIRPDIGSNNYEDIQMDGLNISTGRNEYESAQIIMSATKDIKAYDLTIKDLTLTTDSTVTFSAENIEVYNQHYIQCTEVYESSHLTTPGLYPDGLIPFEAAKEYGENKVSKGSSQGIWVTFYAPKEQEAGEYSGTFTLDIDGYQQEVPVSVMVYDIDFAENYTAQNSFLIDWACFSYSELDTSQDMYDAYAEALLDYRLQPGLIMNDFSTYNAEDMAYYTQKVFEFAQDERCTVVFMPFAYDNNGSDTNLNKEGTKNWIRSFVDASLKSYGTEQQMNLIEKTKIYFTIIDEPFMNPHLIPRVNRITADLASIRTEIKEEYLAKLGTQKDSGLSEEEYAFRLEVIQAVEEISHVLTSMRDERIEGVEIYCPQVHEYDTEEARAQYTNDKERWWYTCVGPHYPYPTYHIDDTNGLMSSRIMSWMQYDYDVVGNLYWSTNMYMNVNDGKEFIENPYTDVAERYPGANGDGFLFYPGKKYGVNGPIGTIRLHAIRDGLEEYEIMEAMQDIYNKTNEQLQSSGKYKGAQIDFHKVYSTMKENLYTNVSCYTTQAYFDDARKLLMNLAELANVGGVLGDVQVSESGAVVQIVLPTGLEVKYEGGTIETQQIGDNILYTFTQAADADKKTFQCVVLDGEKEHSVELDLGGTLQKHTAEQLVNSISVGTRNMNQLSVSNLVSATSMDASATQESWLQLKLPQADGRIQQNMVLSDAELFSQIGSETQKMVISLYYNGDASMDNQGALSYSVQFRYENDEYYSFVRESKLVKGYNEITIGNLFAYDWEDTGKLKDIRIMFGDVNSPAEEQLYFIGVDVYSE